MRIKIEKLNENIEPLTKADYLIYKAIIDRYDMRIKYPSEPSDADLCSGLTNGIKPIEILMAMGDGGCGVSVNDIKDTIRKFRSFWVYEIKDSFDELKNTDFQAFHRRISAKRLKREMDKGEAMVMRDHRMLLYTMVELVNERYVDATYYFHARPTEIPLSTFISPNKKIKESYMWLQ